MARSKCDKVLDVCARGAARLAAYDHKAARKAMDRCLRRYETCRERRLTSGSFAGLGWPRESHQNVAETRWREGVTVLESAKRSVAYGRCHDAADYLIMANEFAAEAAAHVDAIPGQASRELFKRTRKLRVDLNKLKGSFKRRCVHEHGWMGGRSR